MADNTEYSQRITAYYTPNQPYITAEEVLAELERRCGGGQQYTTFPNQISDAEIAKLEAKEYIVTKNYIQSENRDGAQPDDLYIGFQVALTEDATENAMVISQEETNGIDGVGDTYTKSEINTMLAGKANLDESGQIPISEIPPIAMEHMEDVLDDAARFALTTEQVQNGDTVYVDDTKIMYMVIDDTKLDSEAGYKPYAAGTAARAIADKNGNDIATTYQTIIGPNNKISADDVDDTQSTNKFVTAEEKQDISDLKIKVQGIGSTASNYIELTNGQRVYFSSTVPTGTIPDGAIGIGF